MSLDLELTKRVAEKCGLEIEWCEAGDDYPAGFYPIGGGDIVSFDPLNNMNDLMKIVVPRLLKTHWLQISDDGFLILSKTKTVDYAKEGSYPAEFARAVCEALVEVDDG